MVREILETAYQERLRLELALRSNPDFQKLEAVHRLINLYEHQAQVPVAADPILRPDRRGNNARPSPSPDQPAQISDSVPRPDPADRISRRRWTWGNSQTSQIQAAAAAYLRTTGKRATGGEIYKAIASEGVEVGGKKPATVVCARLTSSPIFDRTPKGYGLREWSDGPPARIDELGSG
jgi:hypothetical protein